ncbi:MAG: DUF4304 domain-containing protein [Phycisphaeraceae bacterium]|nr:MAG: DUF4304 domain-containing protein [Phycisphaeraceae bacterium]
MAVAPQPTPDDHYEIILKLAHALLKDAGFKKKKSVFSRETGISTQVIRFAKDFRRWSKDALDFKVGIEITLHAIPPPLWGGRPYPNPHVLADVGWFHTDPSQRGFKGWFRLRDISDPQECWEDVESRLRDHVLPALDEARTVPGIAKLLDEMGLLAMPRAQEYIRANAEHDQA